MRLQAGRVPQSCANRLVPWILMGPGPCSDGGWVHIEGDGPGPVGGTGSGPRHTLLSTPTSNVQAPADLSRSIAVAFL